MFPVSADANLFSKRFSYRHVCTEIDNSNRPVTKVLTTHCRCMLLVYIAGICGQCFIDQHELLGSQEDCLDTSQPSLQFMIVSMEIMQHCTCTRYLYMSHVSVCVGS